MNFVAKSPEIVDFMAPFMLIGQDTVSPLQEVIQKGLIYDLMLRLNKSKSDSALLRPLISAIESVDSTEKEDFDNSEISSENLISNGQNQSFENESPSKSLDVNSSVGSMNKMPEPVAKSHVTESVDNFISDEHYANHLSERDQVRALIGMVKKF